MNSRERVRKALNFEEPDRVPCDLGGQTMLTSICAGAYNRLKEHLGFPNLRTEIAQISLMTVRVQEPIRQALGLDIVPITGRCEFLNEEPPGWRAWDLPSGEGEVYLADTIKFQEADDGGVYMYQGEWNPDAPGLYMPKGGHYFQGVPGGGDALLDAITLEPPKPDLAAIRAALDVDPVSPVIHEAVRTEARYYHENSDYALMANGGWPSLPSSEQMTPFTNAIVLMRQEPDFCHEWFDLLAETAIRRVRPVLDALEDRCDILAASCGDFGGQQNELLPPDLFNEFYVPAYKKYYGFLHKHSDMKLFHHTCGSATQLLPGFIEAGLDIINPVQTMAAGMEPEKLMAELGGKIVFWGGGMDVQGTFPLGTVEDVRADVTDRVRAFMPGGGFVFNAIHNIQDGVPPENIVAAFETAREVGTYV